MSLKLIGDSPEKNKADDNEDKIRDVVD